MPINLTRFKCLITDIDECEETLDDCQRLSQHCINSHGSYFCQDHVSKRCAPGFKVNGATGICEGTVCNFDLKKNVI